MAIFTIRLPATWAGKLDSQIVRNWLEEFLKSPTTLLPADPGPGPLRISISLPTEAEAIIRRVKKGAISREFRRIIRAKLEPVDQLSTSSSVSRVSAERATGNADKNRSTVNPSAFQGDELGGSRENKSKGRPGAYLMGIRWALPVSLMQMGIAEPPSIKPINTVVTQDGSRERDSHEIGRAQSSAISPQICLIYIVAIVIIFAWVVSGSKISTHSAGLLR